MHKAHQWDIGLMIIFFILRETTRERDFVPFLVQRLLRCFLFSLAWSSKSNMHCNHRIGIRRVRRTFLTRDKVGKIDSFGFCFVGRYEIMLGVYSENTVGSKEVPHNFQNIQSVDILVEFDLFFRKNRWRRMRFFIRQQLWYFVESIVWWCDDSDECWLYAFFLFLNNHLMAKLVKSFHGFGND